MSRPRKPLPPSRKPESPQKGPRKPLPEELARDAIAHVEEAPGGKVRMTFRVLLTRQQAEALAARAIQEEKNLETLVGEILEAAARKGKA
jgi:hypothetical protein